MKQPDDKQTLELSLEEAVTKRGRGRPAKEDALTPAQRAKRYRDALRAGRAEMLFNRDENVTKNTAVAEHSQTSRISELEAKVREMSRDLDYKTRSLMTAYSELRIMTEKFEAANKAPKSSLTIKKLQTQCFELQQQITLLTTTEKTKMDELRIENSTLRERIIKMARELDAAQQEVMAVSPRIKVTEAKPSRKKAPTQAK